MAPITNFMEAKGFINFTGATGGGFVENYKIDTTDYDIAKQKLAKILTSRSAILAYAWGIVHATVSAKTVRGDSSIPQVDNTRPTPASGKYCNGPLLLNNNAIAVPADEVDLAVDAVCNDKEVALLFRFDTGTGKRVSRIVRAIRDSWVTNNLVQFGGMTPSLPWTEPDTAALDTYSVALNNYLRQVAFQTRYMEKIPATSPQEYNALAWASIEYQRVSYRDMGRGFSDSRGRRKARI